MTNAYHCLPNRQLLPTPQRAILRADQEHGIITLDKQTTLTSIPPDAWHYQLGSRSALEW